MKKLLLALCLALLPCLAAAEEAPFLLTGVVSAGETALLRLPHAEAEAVEVLPAGAQLTITTLGTAYCEVTHDNAPGYVATADIAFDVAEGAEAKLGIVDVSPTNQYFGRITLREEASRKSRSLCRLAKGCLVLVLGEAGDMVHLALPGWKGYALKKYVTTDVEPVTYTIAYVENDDAVHLRLDSRFGENWVITKLAPGTPVQLIRNPNGWALVEAAGHRARIVADYLRTE